jgi:hypothetical protein
MVGAYHSSQTHPNQSDIILPPVHSADLTAWTEHNEPGELYAEIGLDGVVQRTKAVKQSDVVLWDEKLPMYV